MRPQKVSYVSYEVVYKKSLFHYFRWEISKNQSNRWTTIPHRIHRHRVKISSKDVLKCMILETLRKWLSHWDYCNLLLIPILIYLIGQNLCGRNFRRTKFSAVERICIPADKIFSPASQVFGIFVRLHFKKNL